MTDVYRARKTAERSRINAAARDLAAKKAEVCGCGHKVLGEHRVTGECQWCACVRVPEWMQ